MQVHFSRGSMHFDPPSPASALVAIADGTLQFESDAIVDIVRPLPVLQESVVVVRQWACWLSNLGCTSKD